jgi:hypothetical protein
MKRPTSIPTFLAMLFGVSFSLAIYLQFGLINIGIRACARYMQVKEAGFRFAVGVAA